jgi:DNA-binding XRE family transcriptional regulator
MTYTNREHDVWCSSCGLRTPKGRTWEQVIDWWNEGNHKNAGENSGIKKYRLMRGLTQPELAEMAGVHVSTIYSAERHRTTPSKNTLEGVADALGIDVALIGG